MIKLLPILNEIQETTSKTVLTSRPKLESIKKFHEVTNHLMKVLKNSKSIDKEQLYNQEENTNMFRPSMISKGELKQHIGEYQGNDFAGFTKGISNLYEKAGFKVEKGYGVDDIQGFEVTDNEGEVVGEIDFLIKDSIPNYGDTVIVKHKK